MSLRGLARVWSVLGVLLSLYAVGTWINLQGGKYLADLPGLDARSPVPSAFFAVLIIGFLLGILSWVGILYLRHSEHPGDASLPVVAIADVGPHDMRSPPMLFYQGIFFAVYLLIPAIALCQLDRVLWKRGVVWHEGAPALSAIPLKNAFYWGQAPGSPERLQYDCHEELRLHKKSGDGRAFEWLSNAYCDIVKAKGLAYGAHNGRQSIGDDAESGGVKCSSDLARHLVKDVSCNNATDISELCEVAERYCRGIQWLPNLSPLSLAVMTLFGGLSFVWLLVILIGRRWVQVKTALKRV